jgi:hypothetical protein
MNLNQVFLQNHFSVIIKISFFFEIEHLEKDQTLYNLIFCMINTDLNCLNLHYCTFIEASNKKFQV